MINVVGVLSEIRIQGLGVIADATLDPCDGFTVITGETGAGKTMVVAGLGLLLGGKADTARVRTGSDRTVVEGRLRLTGSDRVPPTADGVESDAPASDAEPAELVNLELVNPELVNPELTEVMAQLDDLGAELDSDGSLILSRTVYAQGRARAHAGGRSVPVGILAAIGEHLVTVHGQSQQLALLRPGHQRELLDTYGGTDLSGTDLLELRRQHRQAFGRWRAVVRELDGWTSQLTQRAARIEELTHGLAQIDAVDPKPGEDAQLREESGRLEHAEALRIATLRAHNALAGDPVVSSEETLDAAALLGTVRGELRAVTQFDPTLERFAQRADELAVLGADLAADLASYTESFDADPLRLTAVHERRAALTALTRAYGGPDGGSGGGGDIDTVLRWAEHARESLASLDTSSAALADLRQTAATEHARVTELAAALSVARADASRRFGDEVTAELAGLAMPHARIAA
ncbi:MAG: AAA family ATPase, partial [Mycobacteriales bacterium]